VIAAAVPDLRAERDAAAACIADEHQELDNAQFAWTVRAVAGVLAAAGLGPGDVLGIMLPNRVEFVTAMFAAWRLGAAVTPINPALAQWEARRQVDDAGVSLVVADETSARKLGDGNHRIVPVEELTSPGPPGRPVPVCATPDRLALLVYAPGATGRPNGVMLDHANIAATANRVVAWFAMDPDTRCLLVLPLLEVNEIVASVVAPLLAGGSTFLAERFDVDAFWATVARVRPTYFSAVPPIFALLASGAGTQADTRNLRFAICSAAPMPPEVIGEFEHRYGVPVVDGYGVSECTGWCTANPVHGIRKPGTVGLPLPGVHVGVVDQRGQLLPAGAAGEVVVRGPNVMHGYRGRPDESAQALHGGWLHTGDVGRFDQDGYLILMDRLQDLIHRRGVRVYPSEVEDVLHTHPAVLDAAVVGRPDPVYREQPIAFVTLRPGRRAAADELIEHCRRWLARYKAPSEVYVEPALPRNAAGTIARPALRGRFGSAATST
jgi:long-chain acyl-CoA synthetase